MKKDCMFLVTRLNGKVVDVCGIDECYTNCSICLDREYLTDDDVKKFYNYMGDDYIERKIHSIIESGSLYEDQEAKDLTCELSKYTVAIEHKEIDFE